MRTDDLQFRRANESLARSPRFVVAILFDVASIYVTSHDDIENVPGVVLEGALKRPSAISQRIVPDEGRSEIGALDFEIVDIDSSFTDEVRSKLDAGAGLRGRTVELWVGYRGFDFSAFKRVQTQLVINCEYEEGVYKVACQDITRQQRTTIFDVKETTLAASISATDTTITVASTADFFPVQHGTDWSDGPSISAFYFKIDKEIIRATGKTSNTFTGCTRGVFNTAAEVHTVDSGSPQERRPKVTEFTYLDMPAPKLALAVLTGVVVDEHATPWPASLLGTQGGFETDSNTDGVSDGWNVTIGGFGDGGRVHVASRPSGSSPFSGTCQRLAITTSTNTADSILYWSGVCRGGLTFTFSAYIRTNASAKAYLLVRYYDASSTFLEEFASSSVAGDSNAHLAQVTSKAPTGTTSVVLYCRGINANGEFMEIDQAVFELGEVAHPYTGAGILTFLPEHWHMGIPAEFVRASDFVGIGADLWDTTDDTDGFITRFEGLVRLDGKRFVEKELYLLMGAYSPVYSDGQLGLKRLPAMVSDAAPVATLTEREIVSIAPLRHDYSSLHNQIRVTWAYDIGVNRFTRDTIFIDGQSVEIHGKAPIIEYSFRGLHSGIHTENMIRQRLNAIRDAYSYPPQRTSVDVLSYLNAFETGDVVRLKVKNVRDFAGATESIDRSFLITHSSIDFATGELNFELFGSTLRPDAEGPSTEVTAPLPDGFYTSAGVALSTLVDMTGNSVDAGDYTINGNASLLASGAIVYHDGDLVIPSDATINITGNVQLRVKGFITLNGDIIGVGGGLAGVSDPGTGTLTEPIAGNPGFIGNSRGWDGIDVLNFSGQRLIEGMRSIPVALTRGRYDAWPELNLRVSGSTLLGLPDDLRGTGGAPGGRTILSYSSSQTAAGGAGGDGGAGLAIICRGISFGVSAQIDLSGEGTSNPAATVLGSAAMPDIFPGAGGAGGPGACLIVLDGNTVLLPNALGRFVARTGTITQDGIPLPERDYTWTPSLANRPANPDLDPWSGYHDEQVISDFDMSIAALRIVYVPFAQTPAAEQDPIPPAVTNLTATGGIGYNTIAASLPAASSFDLVEYYAAITNDRSGAVLVARGRMSEFQHAVPQLASRYYWARTTRTNAAGREFYSAWYPVSSTGGVSATTLHPQGWTPVVTSGGSATMVVTPTTIEKSGGSASWDSAVHSSEGFNTCVVTFRPNDATHAFMIGLNSDRSTNANYTSIDYAWYCVNDGTLRIYENGSGIDHGLTYDSTTLLEVKYDGVRVRYRRNGVTVREVRVLGLSLGLDSSFYDPGAKALDVRFAPNADDADNTDLNRPIPDAEFSRATDDTYWVAYSSYSGGVATGVSIQASGGVSGGLLRLTGDSTDKYVFAKRAEPLRVITGQQFRCHVRWRRTSSISSASGSDQILICEASTTTGMIPPNGGVGSGAVILTQSDLNAATVNQWQESSFTCTVVNAPKSSSQLPFILFDIIMSSACTSGVVEIDAFDAYKI